MLSWYLCDPWKYLYDLRSLDICKYKIRTLEVRPGEGLALDIYFSLYLSSGMESLQC